MKIAAFLFLPAAMLLLPAALFAEVRYTSGDLRDPFRERIEKKVVLEESVSAERALLGIAIQGIVASAKDPRAIVNGRIYRVGDELAPGHKIKWIDKKGIVVLAGDKETLLTLQTKITTSAKPTAQSPSTPSAQKKAPQKSAPAKPIQLPKRKTAQ